MMILKMSFLLGLTILLSGCFELVEEIWINPDNSGRLKLDIAVSEKVIALGKLEEGKDLSTGFEESKKRIENNPDIARLAYQEYSDAGMRHFIFDMAVNDFHKLAAMSRNIAMQ